MGAFISMHHKASAMKVQLSFDSTNKPDHKEVIHPSPSNEKLPVSGHVPVKLQFPPSQSLATFSDFGSKEETFFDSQAWLDSDYEDDFMSVNGEFTPSRGNTPVHHSLTLGTSQVNALVRTTSMGDNELRGSTLEQSPTPTEKKMRLLDLFKESVRDNHDFNKENADSLNQYGQEQRRARRVGSMHGCFSSMLFVRDSRRQKNKTLIPSPIVAPSPVVG